MRIRLLLSCLVLVAMAAGTASRALAAPNVVASVKPLHSLVAGVMAGVGEPTLIVSGGASPHTYSLKPSEARALDRADIVFWFGEELETFLTKPLETLGSRTTIVELLKEASLNRLPARDRDLGGEPDDHDHDHGHGDDHAEGDLDAHVWLDPENAKRIVETVADRLSRLDAANAARYSANAADLTARIDALDRELAEKLRPVQERPFIVFHDAYGHLEERYGLATVGSLTLSPERQPSARHLAEIRDSVREHGVVCIFAEPPFEAKLIDAVVEGSGVRRGMLDPEGASIPPGPELYFELMRSNAQALVDCLTE